MAARGILIVDNESIEMDEIGSLPAQTQEREPNSADQNQSTTRQSTTRDRHYTEKIVTIVVSFVLFCIVITCTVISKVSFISLASCLIIRSNNTTIHENGTGRGYDEVVGWQLLFYRARTAVRNLILHSEVSVLRCV